MQLNSIAGQFKSNVKWSKAELDSVVRGTIDRVNQQWPANQTPTEIEWTRIDQVHRQIDAARDSGNMIGLRQACQWLEGTVGEMAAAARDVPAGPSLKLESELLF